MEFQEESMTNINKTNHSSDPFEVINVSLTNTVLFWTPLIILPIMLYYSLRKQFEFAPKPPYPKQDLKDRLESEVPGT